MAGSSDHTNGEAKSKELRWASGNRRRELGTARGLLMRLEGKGGEEDIASVVAAEEASIGVRMNTWDVGEL